MGNSFLFLVVPERVFLDREEKVYYLTIPPTKEQAPLSEF
jgi:hypothetical protein